MKLLDGIREMDTKKEASKEKSPHIHVLETTYSNQYELHRAFLNIYQILIKTTHGNDFLRPKIINVMSYYMLYGYSSETKEMIKEELRGMSVENLNTINFELQQKGLLIKDPYKDNVRHINPVLKKMQDYVNSFKDKSEKENEAFLMVRFKKV